jgi:hypothetical protein
MRRLKMAEKREKERPPNSDPELMERAPAALARFHSDDPSYRAPCMNVSKIAVRASLKIDHPDEGIGSLLLMEATETSDAHFLAGLLDYLRVVGSRSGEISEGNDWRGIRRECSR